jgi:hypothetical protein
MEEIPKKGRSNSMTQYEDIDVVIDIEDIDLDDFTTEEIENLIDLGIIQADFPAQYYRNEWWNEQP